MQINCKRRRKEYDDDVPDVRMPPTRIKDTKVKYRQN